MMISDFDSLSNISVFLPTYFWSSWMLMLESMFVRHAAPLKITTTPLVNSQLVNGSNQQFSEL